MDLDHTTRTRIKATFTTTDSYGNVNTPKHIDLEITRAKLESLVDKLINKTVGICEKCLKDCHVLKTDITDVILVGGMTRMPKVQQTVEKIFGRKPSNDNGVNPDEVVALGAAMQRMCMYLSLCKINILFS